MLSYPRYLTHTDDLVCKKYYFIVIAGRPKLVKTVLCLDMASNRFNDNIVTVFLWRCHLYNLSLANLY